MNVVVYTALFGPRGNLWSPPPVATVGARYVLFTEIPRVEVGLWTSGLAMLPGTGHLAAVRPVWEQRIVDMPLSPRRTARAYKARSHELFPEADVTIWLDANLLLRVPILKALSWLGQKDLAALNHPSRDCLFDEGYFCLLVGKGTPSRIKAQLRAYEGKGMPRRWGLASTRCVIRRNTSEVASLNEAWRKEIETFSSRDQVSFPYVCWRRDLRWSVIPGDALHCDHFWYMKHKGLP